jgi:diguanylate cyclase (GGDEF)-like protein
MSATRFRPVSRTRVPATTPASTTFERLLIAALAFVAVLHSVHNLMPESALLAAMPGYSLARIETVGNAVTLVLAVLIYFVMARRLRDYQAVHREFTRQHAKDPVSGALARGQFLRKLQSELERRRTSGSVAFVIIDIDHFKQVNDVFGHPAGDEVLGFCTRLARETFPDATVGRLGGDELAVFMSHDEQIPESYVGEAFDAYLAALREGLFINNRRQSVSASLGIAMAPSHTCNLNELLSYADLALYEVKRNGRGAWSVFSTEILADMRQERFIERELRAALLLKQLTVHYQPIVDADGQLNSLEALVRWHNPVRGVISPAEFIPVAEKSRLIHDLGLYVMQRVCEDMPQLPGVPVNVNISAWQLKHDAFLRDYIEVLERNDVTPDRVILEITESAMLNTSDDFVARMAEIKRAGFKIALDDFGMGYSEFNQLRRLPFDIIKIDKSYIQNIGTDIVTDTFVSAVTQIAGQMDRIVVAEGIETRDDNVRASVAGCRLFQGYYYQPPVALADITMLYEDPKRLSTAA